jgi:hypothetical protein
MYLILAKIKAACCIIKKSGNTIPVNILYPEKTLNGKVFYGFCQNVEVP